MVKNHSDLELFRGLKAKKTSALAELYDSYGDIMYSLALQILRNPQEAEDVVQEIFLKLWQNCTYNPDRSSFKSFLIIMVRSRAIDRWRTQKSSLNTLERFGKEANSQDKTNIPLTEAISDEISQKVHEALAQLPENQRQALQMAYYEGMTQVEIAQRFNTPVGTVKSWFRLGFAKLRNSLKDSIG